MIEIRIHKISANDNIVVGDFYAFCDRQALFISGASGAGKTLLARAICGDFQDSEVFSVEGHITVNGVNWCFPDKSPIRVGYVPQNALSFFIASRVRDEFTITHLCTSSSEAEANERINNSIEKSMLQANMNISPLLLSGGQQRLLMLELVIESNPDVLVIDGGMAFLDQKAKIKAREYIQRWLYSSKDRNLICFGRESESDFIEFHKCIEMEHDKNAKKLLNCNDTVFAYENIIDIKIAELAKVEVIRYKNVTGGPLINGRYLISDVSFSIFSGELVVLTGSNGIGKSTLLRLVAGVIERNAGEIYFAGKLIDDVEWKGIYDGIAYLPQEPEAAGPYLLQFAAKSHDLGVINEYEFWCDVFCLSNDERDITKYWEMSAGQRAKLTLAYMASFRPKCYFLDEPTSRLSKSDIKKFISISKMKIPGICFIVISHNSIWLEEMCDRYFLLSKDGIEEISDRSSLSP